VEEIGKLRLLGRGERDAAFGCVGDPLTLWVIEVKPAAVAG
jgi:hypothetical protein